MESNLVLTSNCDVDKILENITPITNVSWMTNNERLINACGAFSLLLGGADGIGMSSSRMAERIVGKDPAVVKRNDSEGREIGLWLIGLPGSDAKIGIFSDKDKKQGYGTTYELSYTAGKEDEAAALVEAFHAHLVEIGPGERASVSTEKAREEGRKSKMGRRSQM